MPRYSSCLFANRGRVDAVSYSFSPIMNTTCGGVSPWNLKGSPPINWSLVVVGHTRCSICSTTSEVPRKWFTYGHFAGLYIASVRSRTSSTFLPLRVKLRNPNGRPSTHMFVCTPTRSTLWISRVSSRFQISMPLSLIASRSGSISINFTCRFQGLRGLRPNLVKYSAQAACSSGSSSSPPSEWSIGYPWLSSTWSIQWHQFWMSFGCTAVGGVAWARLRAGWFL